MGENDRRGQPLPAALKSSLNVLYLRVSILERDPQLLCVCVIPAVSMTRTEMYT